MGFKSVFKALQEVFPQVDARILKAAAIEHSKDADAAVEFILSEVLASSSTAMGPPRGYPDRDYQQFHNYDTPESSNAARDRTAAPLSRGLWIRTEEQIPFLRHKEVVEEVDKGSFKSASVVSEGYAGARSSSNVNYTPLDEVPVNSLISSLYGVSDPDQQHRPLEKHKEVNVIVESHQGPHVTSNIKGQDDVVMASDCNAVPFDNDNDENVDEHKEFIVANIPNQGPHAASSSMTHDDIMPINYRNVPFDGVNDENEQVDGEPDSSICGKSSFEANSSVMTNLSSKVLLEATPVLEELLDFADDEFIDTASSTIIANENLESSYLKNVTEHMVFDSELVDPEENSSSKVAVSHSDQISRIALLEDYIKDAKNNKRTLLSSMEAVIKMMREVELEEKAAEQAKQEAANGGLDIHSQAEDIRQMLRAAKEANDMHAGEVYGEKAILATEARELQSRLHNLSDERDKSLAILDKMRQALEARLVAAKEIRKVVEQEKLDKEESARRYFAEQQDLMEKVVQESKQLQLEAEENSKLREFLMDRGLIVDMLQGEIAVVCKDIKLLKEKCDNRVPLSESLCSSQTSCRLASSGLSNSSKTLPEQPELSESTVQTAPPPSTVDEPKTSTPKEQGFQASRKTFFDDDWEMFEDEMALHDA
ncbi:hypothetical protein Scep_009309 [Stephania cephalantha]|uniref:CUE domain-containing protein n=1 Tax=Stephania cephalantha TaxID=152367 RepID=A0AAP0PCF0_9MAGN